MPQATDSASPSLHVRPAAAAPDGSDDLIVALLDVLRHSRRPLEAAELDPPALVVLASASRLDPARPSDIACELRLNLSTVSRHLANLHDGGYISRTDDPDDRRAQRVQVSERGLDLLRATLQQRTQILNAATSDWSADDRTALTTLLRRLADELERHSDERRGARKDNA